MGKLKLTVFKNSLQWKSGGEIAPNQLKPPQADWFWKALFNTCVFEFKFDEARLRLEAVLETNSLLAIERIYPKYIVICNKFPDPYTNSVPF